MTRLVFFFGTDIEQYKILFAIQQPGKLLCGDMGCLCLCFTAYFFLASDVAPGIHADYRDQKNQNFS